MDTQTVLKIIAMLDNRIDNLNKDMKAIDASGYSVLSKRQILDRLDGASQALERLSNHLQSYIESQVNQVENEMNRGE